MLEQTQSECPEFADIETVINKIRLQVKQVNLVKCFIKIV